MTATRAQATIKVLLIDDHPLVREGLRTVLDSEPDLELMGEAATGAGALAFLEKQKPQVILLDLNLPDADGVAMVSKVKAAAPESAIVILTIYDSEGYLMGALQEGVAGYILKDQPQEVIPLAIRAAAAGGSLYPQAHPRAGGRQLGQRPLDGDRGGPFTAGAGHSQARGPRLREQADCGPPEPGRVDSEKVRAEHDRQAGGQRPWPRGGHRAAPGTRELNLGTRPAGGQLELNADRLVTHGVILGMTGSGKTGLGVVLLEELAARGVPLLIVDPKGDLAALNLPGLRVFTPGSRSGQPVNVLGSLACPPGGYDRELVTGTVSGLLSLVGVPADPVRSPEHVVLSHVLEAAWMGREELTLEGLILRLVEPPFQKVGVFPLDTFYPPEQRLKLAMLLNAVLASPAFSDWTAGEPLELESLTRPGSASVFYLAHLSDAERMFFLSLLLERTVNWTRRLNGTSSLRALLFFDEAAGYLPPHPRDPASKKPILTLLKQARAVGLGVVLATQNPVDLDYKALSNAGTWLIGRLQTAQDRERVAEGMLTAGSGSDRARLLELFGQLKPRVFALKTADGDEPVLFATRDARGPLRGPLTLADLGRLAPPPAAPSPKGLFLAHDAPTTYTPAVHGELELRFENGHIEVQHRVFLPATSRSSQGLALQTADLQAQPPADGIFEELPAGLDLQAAQRAMLDEVAATVTAQQWVLPALKLVGSEARPEFERRCREELQGRIDAQVEKLQAKSAKQVATLEDRITRQRAKVAQLEAAVQGKQADQLLHAGEMVLGFFTGSKRSLAGALSKQRASANARGKAEAAAAELANLEERLWALQEKAREERAAVKTREYQLLSQIEARPVKLRRSNIRVLRFGILWLPAARRV